MALERQYIDNLDNEDCMELIDFCKRYVTSNNDYYYGVRMSIVIKFAEIKLKIDELSSTKEKLELIESIRLFM